MKRFRSSLIIISLTFICFLFIVISSASLGLTNSVPHLSEDTDGSEVYLPIIFNSLTPIIPETTEVLTEETTQYLQSVSEDRAIFLFSQSTQELVTLDVGDVIVSGPTDAAPYGFLRRVTSMNNSGDQVIVTTEFVTLEEAVEQGSFNLSHTLTPNDVELISMRDGVSIQSFTLPTGEEGWNVEIDVLEQDCLKITGSVSISNLDVDIGGEIRFFDLKEFRAIVTMDIVDDITFEIVCEVSTGILNFEQPLAQFVLGAMVVPIGPIPLVFATTLDVVVGAESNWVAGISFEGNLNMHIRAGPVYRDGNFSIGEVNINATGDSPQPIAGYEGKGYVGPEVQMLAYGFAGAYVRASGFLEFEVDAIPPGSWKLYYGVEAPVGLELDILGREIKEYKALSIIYRELWKEGSGLPPIPPTVQISHPNSQNQWIVSWTYAGPVGDNFEIQESQDSDFSTILDTRTVTGNVSSSQFQHPLSIKNEYFYRVRAISTDGTALSGWSAPASVVGGYYDDFTDPSTGWAIRRTTNADKVSSWYEKNGDDYWFIMQVEDSWDWGIAAPYKVRAPKPPYAIEYRSQIAHTANLVSHGAVFGADWPGGTCPDYSSVAGIYQHNICFNHFYNTNIIWYGRLMLIFERVDYLEWSPQDGGSPMKRHSFDNYASWFTADIPNVDPNGWNTYRIEVRDSGIKMFANDQQYASTADNLWVNEPYFGVFASTDEYNNSTWWFDYYKVTPLDR